MCWGKGRLKCSATFERFPKRERQGRDAVGEHLRTKSMICGLRSQNQETDPLGPNSAQSWNTNCTFSPRHSCPFPSMPSCPHIINMQETLLTKAARGMWCWLLEYFSWTFVWKNDKPCDFVLLLLQELETPFLILHKQFLCDVQLVIEISQDNLWLRRLGSQRLADYVALEDRVLMWLWLIRWRRARWCIVRGLHPHSKYTPFQARVFNQWVSDG